MLASGVGGSAGGAGGAGGGDRRLIDQILSGGPVGYVLIVLSVVALALVIANAVQLRRDRLAPPAVIAALEETLRRNDVEGARAVCAAAGNESFLSRMFGSALTRCSRSAFGFLEMRSALEESGTREIDRLTKLTDGVGLVAAVAPMLGLLGTVFGMIGAFQTIGTLEGASRSNQLAVYMSHALVTTALGLTVAIPCTAAYTYFKRRIDRLAGEIGQLAEDLASHLQGKGAGAKAASAGVRGVPAAGPGGGGARVAGVVGPGGGAVRP
ncbi:MAG: MotA/TolQ/ExbB proton channel family protein [Phycisphaeraceae bacterium]|nr:MAG: MotA/TolQ/ExbB proton channel family protein [Phycisphaeraceae bacterium]